MSDLQSFSLTGDGKLVINLNSAGTNRISGADGEAQNKSMSQALIKALAEAGIPVSGDRGNEGEDIRQLRGRTPGVAIFAGEEKGYGTPQAQFTIADSVDCTDPAVIAKIAKALKIPGVLTVEGDNITASEQQRTVMASISPAELAQAGDDLTKLTQAAKNPVRQAELGSEFVLSAADQKLEKARAAADLVKPKTPVQHSTQGEVAAPAQTPTIQKGLQEFSREITTLLGKKWLQEGGPEGLGAFAVAEEGNAAIADKARYAIGIIQQLQESFNNPKQFNALVTSLTKDKDVMKSLENAVNSSGDYFHFERRLKNYQEHPLPEAQPSKQR